MKKIILALVTLLITGSTISQTVVLNPAFGDGGFIRTNVFDLNGRDERRTKVAIQPDGKIILANDIDGEFPWLIRINPNGSRDSSFKSAPFNKMTLQAMILQDDGKILIAGSAINSTDITYDFAIARLKSNGSVDSSFGTAGKVMTDFGATYASIFSITLQADHKIVAAGYSGSLANPEINGTGNSVFALARFNSNGSLDNSFSGDGKLTTVFPSARSEAYDVLVKADGKIVAVGLSGNSGSSPATNFAIAQYNTDGSPDINFSGDGLEITSVGTTGKSLARAVAIQPDNKIVSAGSAINGSGNSDFALIRYNEDGSLDNTFNGGFPVLTDFSGSFDYAFDIVLPGNGKIIAAGNGNVLTPGGPDSEFALAMYNDDGSPDIGFDGDGKLLTDMFDQDFVDNIVLQADGKIIAGGHSSTGSGQDMTVARYDVAGNLDPTFDADGKFTSFLGASTDKANAMLVQADGKILVAGNFGNTNFTSAALVRYNPDGNLDTSFGDNGKALTGLTAVPKPVEFANAIAVQSDGKIIVAGSSNADFALWRYNADGNPDLSFGINGRTITAVSTATDIANAVAIQNDGKIVITGYAFAGTVSNFAVVRYNSNGTPDGGFGTGGIVITTINASHTRAAANAIAIQSDNKIVVGGYTGQVVGHTPFALARYNTNGSLDVSFDGEGTLTTSFGTLRNQVTALAIQNDNKILATGLTGNGASEVAIARYNTDGSLDNGFGTGGMLTTSFGPANNYSFANTMQADGKILIAGSSGPPGSDFVLARYNTNGTPDNSFDSDGKLTLSFWENFDASDLPEEARAIQVVGNTIYVAGSALSDFVLIVLQNSATLPLDFLEFTAAWYNDDDVLLHWKTANEENTLSFDVEQSMDGSNFDLVGNVASANSPGEHQYSFVVHNASSLSAPRIYYRLKQKDIDGRFIYSKIVSVAADDQNKIQVYPNPVTTELNLAFSANVPDVFNLSIADNMGRILRKQQWQISSGDNKLLINIKNLAKGMYYLQLEGKTIRKNFSFIKQ